MIEHKMPNGVTVFYLESGGNKFACVEELGLQISCKVGEKYDEKEFADFARKDIAERITKGE